MRNRYAITSAAILLAAGGSSTAPELIPYPTLSPERVEFIQEENDANKAYWLSQGIGGAAQTNLVILQGYERFTCKNKKGEKIMDALDRSIYCPGTNSLVVPAGSVNKHYDTPDSIGELGVAASLAHEYGHVIQDLEGRLKPINNDNQAKINLEVDATKLSGQFLVTRYSPAHVETMAVNIGQSSFDIYGSTLHGDALLEGAGL